MSHRDKRLQVYLQSDEYSQLAEWSEKTGKSMSELARDAILEFTDEDRAARLSDQLEQIEEKIDGVAGTVSEINTHTHTSGQETKMSPTMQRTHEIAERLDNNYDVSTTEKNVERAIKDIAGGDERVIDKYMGELKDRGHAFEHPNESSPVWYTERDPFFDAVVGYAKQTPNPEGTANKLLEEYNLKLTDMPEQYAEQVLAE